MKNALRRLYFRILPDGPDAHSIIFLGDAEHHHVAVDVAAADLSPFHDQLHRGDPAKESINWGLFAGIVSMFPAAAFLYIPSVVIAILLGASGPMALGVWGLVVAAFGVCVGLAIGLRHSRTRGAVLAMRQDAEGNWQPVGFEAPLAGLMPTPSAYFDVYDEPLSTHAFARSTAAEALRALGKGSPLLLGIAGLIGGSVILGG